MSIAKKALTGTLFVAANTYVSMFISLITGIFLRRILGSAGPADYGIYRLALFFADLFGRAREFGLDKALIHRQENLTESYKTHFTLQLSLSTLSFFVALASGPIMLRYYPAYIYYFLIIISFGYILYSLSSTQRVYLEKNLNFKTTTIIDFITLLLSSIISILLAFRGWGALSLVIGYSANYLFSFVLFWFVRPWKVTIRGAFNFDKDDIKWFLKFGSFLFFGGLTTFVLFKYNDFILGTFLNPAVLGYYATAFNYAQIPTSVITGVISRVALPTYSSLQNDKEKLSEAFSIVLKSIVRLSFPLSLILYLVADDFTVFILGNNWSPMVPIFRILLVYGVLRSVFDDLGELFTAVGKPKYVSIYLFIQALVSLGLAPILTNIYRASGAAISLSIVLAIGVIIAYQFLKRVVRIPILSIFLPTIVICVLTLISFKFVVFRFGLNWSYPLYSLMTKGIVFSVIYLLFMTLIDGKAFLKDFKFFWVHLRLKEKDVVELSETGEKSQLG